MLLTTSMSIMLFLIEILFILYETKSDFQGSYDKQNLTLAEGSFHKFQKTNRVRSSIFNIIIISKMGCHR